MGASVGHENGASHRIDTTGHDEAFEHDAEALDNATTGHQDP